MNKAYALLIFLLLVMYGPVAGQEVRTIDGSHNNIEHPDWGARLSPLSIPSGLDFADSVGAPAGADRPSPRVVSNGIFAQDGRDLADPLNMSEFCWAFGQLIDHDVILVSDDASQPAQIPIPACDPYFDPQCTGTAYIPVFRTRSDPTSGTSPDNPRRYLNEITHWVDASFLYGSTESRAQWLRSFEGGRLRTSAGDLLPYNTLTGEYDAPIDPDAPAMAFVSAAPGPHKYFVAGDVRANENILLTVLQTIWLREHNRLADSLSAEYPQWSDERVFQKARRLVIALMQHITFDEWLPSVGIHLPAYGGYNPYVTPNISNLFSVASFRIGHSLVGQEFWRLDERGDTIPQGNIRLKDAYFQSHRLLAEAGLDPIVRGMAAHHQQAFDAKLVDDLRNRLFGAPGQGGLDLAAINIFRGRERGIPDFNSVRLAFGLTPYTSIDQITADADKLAEIQSVYDDVNNIDVWVGMLLEDPLPGKLMGETMHKTLFTQFRRLRDGDRFYYLNDPELSQSEIRRIQQTALSDIVRRNTHVKHLQHAVFYYMPRDEIVMEQVSMPEDRLASVVVPNPVPAGDAVAVVVSSPVQADGELVLTDISGRRWYARAMHLDRGRNIFHIPTGQLPKGVYLVDVMSAGSRTTQKLLVE